MGAMQFAAALSEHPVPSHATGEVVGALLESLDSAPDLVCLFVTPPHAGALDDIVRTVRTLLNPRVLVGAAASAVLGGSREVEDRAAISLFGARLGVDIAPMRFDSFEGGGGETLIAGGAGLGSDGTLLLLTDPFSFPVEAALEGFGAAAPELLVAGGVASAGRGPGGNRLLLDDEQFRDGAVGVHLPSGLGVRHVVSQGCRPFGRPFVATRAAGGVVYELGGRPALERLEEQVAELDDSVRPLLAGGIRAGIVIDEHRTDFGPGDFLVREVLGADRSLGALSVEGGVVPGTTVQFQLCDATCAGADLRSTLSRVGHAGGALLFSGTERTNNLFDSGNNDVSAVAEVVRAGSVGGMFCAGEIGPLTGQSFLHGSSASIILFDVQSPGGPP